MDECVVTVGLCKRYGKETCVDRLSLKVPEGAVYGFLGLMSMFFPPAVMRLSPAAYYGLLSNVRMVWDRDTRVVTYFRQPFSWSDLGLVAAAMAALYLWGRRDFVNREV